MAGLDEALATGGERPTWFLLGLAPSTGLLSAPERAVVLRAMALGLGVVNGLHEFLNDDPEFLAAAVLGGVEIIDVRRPPDKKDLHMFLRRIDTVTCPRIAVLGTDGAIGKRTTSTLLAAALEAAGLRTSLVGTGQTSLIQGARHGAALDAVPAQFCAGEMEHAVVEAFEQDRPDVIVIEGQGALSHPAYLTSAYILRGSRPDAVILQHAPRRRRLSDFPDQAVPTAASEIHLIETFADTKVIGVTLNHEHMTELDVDAAIIELGVELGLPVTDALLSPPGRLVEMVIAAFPALQRLQSASCEHAAARGPAGPDRAQRSLVGRAARASGHQRDRRDQVDARVARAGVDDAVGRRRRPRGLPPPQHRAHARRWRGRAITLLRTPMLSQTTRVVELCDRSCNTEPAVLEALSAAAVALGVVHEVMLMVELGDLREGVMPDDLVGVAELTQDLPNLRLVGVGANLACRSGVVPGAANMAELSSLATRVEHATGEALRVVSGGNSANLGWALGTAAIGRVNDLRLGEAVLLGVDPVERRPIDGLRCDAVTLHAEVIESGTKPSLPWGTTAQTAFGERPLVVDRGAVVQTIVALGRQDTDTTDLHEPPGMAIVASSSDHLITWTDQRIAPGTEVVFRPGYAAVLRAVSSRSVEVLHRSASPTRR